MGIVLINQSTLISDADVQDIANACDHQLRNDVGAAWNINKPQTVTTTPDQSAYPFFMVDDIPEAPGALAYHFVQANGIPAGKIGVGTTLKAGELVSVATSHEAVELQCDIFCASWSYSNALKCLVATEACDPVETETYKVKVPSGASIEVSNFVTPYYFTDDALGNALDQLGTLKKTFEIAPGGYQIRMKGGKITQKFGAEYPAALRKAKDLSQGRAYWRQITMALAMS
jgi:hypothetical protein